LEDRPEPSHPAARLYDRGAPPPEAPAGRNALAAGNSVIRRNPCVLPRGWRTEAAAERDSRIRSPDSQLKGPAARSVSRPPTQPRHATVGQRRASEDRPGAFRALDYHHDDGPLFARYRYHAERRCSEARRGVPTCDNRSRRINGLVTILATIGGFAA